MGAESRALAEPSVLEVRDLRVRYGAREVIHGISCAVPRNGIYGIIGPANSGKTTFLSCLNRTIDLVAGASSTGEIRLDGLPTPQIEPSELRRRVAMVLPLPVGLPMSIYDNVAFAPRMVMRTGLSTIGEIISARGFRRIARLESRRTPELDETVERCLRQAALWDEVKDRLDELGTKLSGGQQQRLTLARALSTDPDVLCLDEFSIAIDPVTTMRIESVLLELKEQMTIVLVTNLLAQARRIADRTAFFLQGELVEESLTEELFASPRDRRTLDYVNGKFG